MILTSLKMQNYKRYKDFEIEFTEGLTGILGRNGSGKSTIFNAVIFALYGDTRGEKETIRHAKADKTAAVCVELRFEIDQKSYKVVRQMRGKNLVAKAYLYDDKKRLLCESSKEVTKFVSKLLGMSKEAFMHTVFASQKELTALSTLKNEERRKIVRKLLGLEKIDKMEIEIKTAIRDLRNEIETIEALLLNDETVSKMKEEIKIKNKELSTLNAKIKKSENDFNNAIVKLARIDKNLKNLKNLKEEYDSLQNSLILTENSLKNQNQNLEKTQYRLEELIKKRQDYEKDKYIIEEYKNCEAEIAGFQRQKELYLKKEGLLRHQVLLRTQYRELENEINGMQKELYEKPLLVKRERNLIAEHKESLERLGKIEFYENELREDIARYRALIKDSENKIKKIQKIGKNSNCPTCTRALLDEYDNVIESLQKSIVDLNEKEIVKREKKMKETVSQKDAESKKISALEKEQKIISQRLSVLNAMETTLKKKRKDFKAVKDLGLKNKNELKTLKDIKYDEKKHKAAVNKKASVQKRYKELLGTGELLKQIDPLKSEVGKLQKNIQDLKSKIENLKKMLKKHVYNVREHEETELLYKKTLLYKDEIYEVLSGRRVLSQKLKGELSNLRGRLQRDLEQKKTIEKKLNDKRDFQKLKVFTDGFKNKINSAISPRISRYASEMYAAITRGRYQYIEVNDEFDFFIYDDGVRYPLDRFSGGEIDLANLVLRIAISRTLSELSGSGGVGFLAFDEIFGSQDEERRYEILEAFHSIKERYRQVFLISHESEIKDMFEKVIEL